MIEQLSEGQLEYRAGYYSQNGNGSTAGRRLGGTMWWDGKLEQGWVFPLTSREGHFDKDTAKDQHKKAIDSANAKAKKDGTKALKHSQPYVLRHTALTQLAQAGCDAFTLARIAGHSSITITQRYIHPQADAIERAFAPFAAGSVSAIQEQENSKVGPKLGTAQEDEKCDALQAIGAKGGTRTPTVLPARS